MKLSACSPRNLKDVETAEKNVLPTADDVKAEKTHQGLIEGVENFSSEKLKSVKTREPASGKDGEIVKSNLLVIFNPVYMRDFE